MKQKANQMNLYSPARQNNWNHRQIRIGVKTTWCPIVWKLGLRNTLLDRHSNSSRMLCVWGLFLHSVSVTVILSAILWPFKEFVKSTEDTLKRNHWSSKRGSNARFQVYMNISSILEYSRIFWIILQTYHYLLPTLREEEDDIIVSSSESSSESPSSSASCHSTLGPRWKRRRVPEYQHNNVKWWMSRYLLGLIGECWKMNAILLFGHQRADLLYKYFN